MTKRKKVQKSDAKRTIRVRVSIEGTIEFTGDQADAVESARRSPFGSFWFGAKSGGEYKPDHDTCGDAIVKVEVLKS